MQTFNEFQTIQTLQIDGPVARTKPLQSLFIDAQYNFPFDSYALQSVFIVLDSVTNQSVPIIRVAPVDCAQSFAPTFNDFATLSNFNNSIGLPSRSVELTLVRAIPIRALAVIVVILNWLLTGTVVFVTIVACRQTARMPDALLLLPITVILTLPALRALVVGFPDQSKLRVFLFCL
jgi:hypothetical protein